MTTWIQMTPLATLKISQIRAGPTNISASYVYILSRQKLKSYLEMPKMVHCVHGEIFENLKLAVKE